MGEVGVCSGKNTPFVTHITDDSLDPACLSRSLTENRPLARIARN